MFVTMTISVSRCLKIKVMLVWVKEYIIKNFATCKSLCNLQELYIAFKQNHANVNIGFAKFLALRPKWCDLAGSKMTHFVCVCSAPRIVVLLLDAKDWDLTNKDLLKLTLSCLKYFLQSLFVIMFISPSFTTIFFLTGILLVHLI